MIRLALFLSISIASAQEAAPNAAAVVDQASRLAGDVARGRVIFADESRVACIKCHSTDGHGGKAGPDLSAIADKFAQRDLVRSIVEPSATIAVGYGTTVLETKSGEIYEGVIKQATESWLEIIGGDGKPVRIQLAAVKEQRTSEKSLMPEGLAASLKPQEFADLIAYLGSLHQAVEVSRRIQGVPEVIAQASRGVEFHPLFSDAVKLRAPVWCGEMRGRTNRFVVLEQAGKSWVIDHTPDGDEQTLLLDMTSEVRLGAPTGLLGLAFHPKFSENRKYYLKYQALKDSKIVTRIIERQFAPDFKTDSGTAPRLLLEIPTATQDHNGGTVEFGPDGFLYFGMGDSGPQNDPQGHAQDLSLLWGKMLRIDVDHPAPGKAYGIPTDNPFVNRTNARPEIWAYGFREPWRFTFDSRTGDLWVGDVGQDRVEEVSLVRVGENYGWNIFEGHASFSEKYRRPGENYIAPVFSYWHRTGVSATGGYVYRGNRAPQMFGRYICGDFETRRIWALTHTNRMLASIVEIGRAPSRLVSFMQDHSGELFTVGYDSGLIYRLDLNVIDPTPRESQVIAATSEENPMLWRYTIDQPNTNWSQSAFDDTAWKLSPAGFGSSNTPGTVVRTDWHASDIWLRRSFNFVASSNKSNNRSLALRLHHDEDAEIYLNGVQIAREPRWTTGYVEVPLDNEATQALQSGRNVLAIHCHQNSGGQYIDAGLIEYSQAGK